MHNEMRSQIGLTPGCLAIRVVAQGRSEASSSCTCVKGDWIGPEKGIEMPCDLSFFLQNATLALFIVI